MWENGDPVLLWDAGELELPFRGGERRFERCAVVTAVVAAGADRKQVLETRVLEPVRSLPVANQMSRGASKLVLRIEPEVAESLPGIPEVHVLSCPVAKLVTTITRRVRLNMSEWSASRELWQKYF